MLDTCHFLQVADTDGISPQATAVYLNGQNAQATTFNTAAHYIGDAGRSGIAFSCPSTGTPVGTVTLQVSYDVSSNQQRGPQFPDAGLANWFNITDPVSGLTNIPISSATQVAWNLRDHSFRWFRLVYTRTSGSITPTASVQNKRG
jgi:hypothetical protein